MDDEEIIRLYWQRSEQAIKESRDKYGGYCGTIARNILSDRESAEECVSDTLIRAWETIPPNQPERLGIYLGKLTRNLAIDRYRSEKAQRRGGGQAAICLNELAECVGSGENFADDVELKEILSEFIKGLKPDARNVFMLRYWYLYPISDVAAQCGMSEGAVKMSLRRTRKKLKDFLIQSGFDL